MWLQSLVRKALDFWMVGGGKTGCFVFVLRLLNSSKQGQPIAMIAGTRTNEETGKVLALRTRPGTYNQTNVKVRRGPKLRDPTKTKKKKKTNHQTSKQDASLFHTQIVNCSATH